MNIMPQWLRDQFRAFYLRRELEQIDQNEAHYMETMKGYQKEIDKGAERRATIVRELRGISA